MYILSHWYWSTGYFLQNSSPQPQFSLRMRRCYLESGARQARLSSKIIMTVLRAPTSRFCFRLAGVCQSVVVPGWMLLRSIPPGCVSSFPRYFRTLLVDMQVMMRINDAWVKPVVLDHVDTRQLALRTLSGFLT